MRFRCFRLCRRSFFWILVFLIFNAQEFVSRNISNVNVPAQGLDSTSSLIFFEEHSIHHRNRKLSAADYVTILNLFPCAASAIEEHQTFAMKKLGKEDVTEEEVENDLKFEMASYASGSFVDGLFLFLKMRDMEKEKLNLGPDDQLDRLQSLHLLELGFPLSSFGQVDGCKFLGEENYHYCHFSIAGPFWKYGLCMPSQCTTDDVQAALEAIFGPQGIQIKNSQCGYAEYEWLPGTYVMVIISFVLLFFLVVGTLLEAFDSQVLLLNNQIKARKEMMTEENIANGNINTVKTISSISNLSDMLTNYTRMLKKKNK